MGKDVVFQPYYWAILRSRKFFKCNGGFKGNGWFEFRI